MKQGQLLGAIHIGDRDGGLDLRICKAHL